MLDKLEVWCEELTCKKPEYCPICGQNIKILELFARTFNELIEQHRKETVKIDGEELEYVRVPSDPKTDKKEVKPMDMSIDLDKIDISKEMLMLGAMPMKIDLSGSEILRKKWMEFMEGEL